MTIDIEKYYDKLCSIETLLTNISAMLSGSALPDPTPSENPYPVKPDYKAPEEIKPEPVEKEIPTDDIKLFNTTDISAKVRELVQAGKSEAAKNILTQHGYSRVKDIKAEDGDTIYEELCKL